MGQVQNRCRLPKPQSMGPARQPSLHTQRPRCSGCGFHTSFTRCILGGQGSYVCPKPHPSGCFNFCSSHSMSVSGRWSQIATTSLDSGVTGPCIQLGNGSVSFPDALKQAKRSGKATSHSNRNASLHSRPRILKGRD